MLFTDFFITPIFNMPLYYATLLRGEKRWPHGLSARLGSEQCGFEPWQGKLCCVLGKTLLSWCPSHTGVQMVTGELNAGGNPAMDLHPIQEGIGIHKVASCYRNRDKLRPDFTFIMQCISQIEASTSPPPGHTLVI